MEISFKNQIKKQFLEVFDQWKKEKPERLEETKKRMREYQKTRANIFGADKEFEFRFMFTIPTELDRAWNLIYPGYIHQKWLINFLAKEFKGLLLVPEKY